jgi:EAL domain-containing protein (putative c-di-GMP-specific phosphodiesterase class I)
MVKRTLVETGLSGRFLRLEVTETVAMKDIQHTIAILHEFKEMGIELAIDDFGTGYSSMAYLRELPFDALKIDKGFIAQMMFDKKAADITRAMIDLSHSLKFKVVAEGVETIEQYTFLKRQGCDQIQGFLACEPMPAGEVETFISRGAWPQVALAG